MSKVSVIMAAYNEEAYIGDAINSILRQTLHDFELIIVDDGSDDKTPEIAERNAEKDRRIKVIHQGNSGVAHVWNLGINTSKGDYIAILDADDIAHPERLEKQARFLDDHPEIGIVGSWCEFVDVLSGKRWIWKTPLTDRKIRKYVVKGKPIAHTTTMMRREVFDAIGGYRDMDFKDYDFVIRGLEKFSGANIPEVLVTVNVHPGSVMTGTHIRKMMLMEFRCRMRAILTFSPRLKIPLYTIHAILIVMMRTVKRLGKRKNIF